MSRYIEYAAKKQRKQDDRLLGWLNARWQGVKCKDIASADGNVSHNYVRAATNRVRAADAEEHDTVLIFN